MASAPGSRRRNSSPPQRPARSDREPSFGARPRTPQHVVADGVPVVVVDGLEVVEVGEHEGQRRAEPLGAGDLRRQRVLALPPVRDAGEAVDERLPLDDAVQPRVLECDRGVRGERARSEPLLVVERVARDRQRAERRARGRELERRAARRRRRGRRSSTIVPSSARRRAPLAPVASTAASTITRSSWFDVVRSRRAPRRSE